MKRKLISPKNFIAILALTAISFSAIILSSALNKNGNSAENAKAAYPTLTPTPLPTSSPTPVPTVAPSAKIDAPDCTMPAGSPPGTHCQTTVTWSSQGLTRVYVYWITTVSVLLSNSPSGSEKMNLTNTRGLKCATFRIYNNTTLMSQDRACIKFI